VIEYLNNNSNYVAILFLLIIALKTLRTLYFLQLKEYRLDRLYDFVKYDSGLRQIFSVTGILATLFFAFALLFNSVTYFLVALVIAILDLLYLNLFKARLRFKPTAKSILIYGINLATITLFNIDPLDLFHFPLEILAYSYILAGLSLFILTLIFTPITHFAKEYKISLAKKRVSQFPDLVVIGITGSYGKSSTKEYISHLLESKFGQEQVLKTPKNINSDIGIANLILSSLKPTHKFFVVEMGAYRIGEIANCVKMFPLDFAVVTAMADQHLSLFGSTQNIQIGKSEIANSLKPTGSLFLNLDSQGVQQVLNGTTQTAISTLLNQNLPNQPKIFTYGQHKDSNLKLEKVAQSKDNLAFTVNQKPYTTTAFGPHNATNLAPAIQIATTLGLAESEIAGALQTIVNPSNTLCPKKGTNNTIILDDSYNANTQGFLSAMTLCQGFFAASPRKILITRGMLELGSSMPSDHKLVAEAASKVFDLVIITQPNIYAYFEPFFPPEKLVLAEKPQDQIDHLKPHLHTENLILVENRLNPLVYNSLFPE
jgi:UDP-N-acetylmuramoyl-tripeptide--D-alanyl-D-alanine ligase